MLEYIYVCRHGFRSNWQPDGWSRAPTDLIRDHPSDDLAAFLAAPRDVPAPERIVASPWYRCVQTAAPLARRLQQQIHLDHGPAEWYAHAAPGTGLHPRPIMDGAASMARHFAPGLINEAYGSTLYPSRRGESMRELHERVDLFAKTFVRRMDDEGVRSVVIFAHAATVIALGRALTGDPKREVTAACACTSLYKRIGTSDHFEQLWNGRTDYLPLGLERDWSFDAVELENGEVVDDEGDMEEHSPEDELPVGLAPGMEKYAPKTRVVSRL